jgi:hypothetical protein
MTIVLTPLSNLTAGSLVLSALNLLGIEEAGEVSTPEDIQEGIRFLNLLLDEYSLDRDKIYVRAEDIKTLTIGKGTYTIGVGGEIDTVLPESIEQAYLRNTQLTPPLDYPLDPGMSQEDYNGIPVKSIQTIPTRLFLLKQYPIGSIIFDYLPNYTYELHAFSWKPFTRINDMNQGLMLPPGYEAFLACNLAVFFGPAFGKEAPQSVVLRAERLAAKIGAKNYETPRVHLQGVPGTRRVGGSIYNPFVKQG